MAADVLADPALREGVLAIAQEAARAILAVYEGDFDVMRKADASPLTEADLAAHRCIVAGLSRLTPGIRCCRRNPRTRSRSNDAEAGTACGWSTRSTARASS